MVSVLKRRIATVQQTAPDLTVVGRYATPEDIPNNRVVIRPGYLTYETMYPLITADGAPVAATSAGTWGQLYAAGQP